MNKVVVRFTDGRIIKGTTADFFPNKETFHVSVADTSDRDKPLEVNLQDLKALYFVKNFDGNPQHERGDQFDSSHSQAGRQIKVVFKDDEILLGTTTGYQPQRQGFFVVPADAGSNNERCYVVTAATKEVSFL